MKKAIKITTLLLSIACTIIMFIGIAANYYFPSSFKITPENKNKNEIFTFVTLRQDRGSTVEANLNNSTKTQENAQLMLCNIIPIKNVKAVECDDIKVVPGGNAFGIKMFTKGVMVVKIDDITVENRCVSPGKNCGLQIGDVITAVNGNEINSNGELLQNVAQCKGCKLDLNIERSGESKTLSITPVFCNDSYKIGIWVRDSSAGIGTATFYINNTGYFAGLGHGICDVDTGLLLPILNGEIMNVNIDGIIKGQIGAPGCINGHFTGDSTGKLYKNNETGIFGSLSAPPNNNDEIYVAAKQEVKTGSAEILCTVDDNGIGRYSIEIEKINYNTFEKTKNLVIRITDSRLLEKTGGIVQGMSGSPIIQNNKLVGAVTHVFVNEPQKGYGIFAENMLSDYDEDEIMLENDVA